LNDATSDSQLAQRWAAGLCAHVMNVVRTREGGTANVIAFADESAYIAAFVDDLVGGRAWDRWYYGAFARYRGLPLRDAVLGALSDDKPLLPNVVRGLARAGSFDAVLTALGAEGAAALWRAIAEEGTRPADAAEFRIIVRAALAIAASLGLRCAAGEDATLAAYAALSPSPPDWADRRSLSRAVLSALRFAARGSASAQAARAAGAELAFAPELRADLDWLDADWLATAVGEWFAASGPAEAFAHAANDARSAFARAGTGATPAQQRLLDRLREQLASGRLALDRSYPSSEANALRLYAALTADSGGVADSAVRSLVVLMLAAWKALLGSVEPLDLIGAIHEGRVDMRTAMDRDAEALQALRSAAALGEPAAAVLTQLLAVSAGGADAARAIGTRCAGVFLLARAVSDARLPQLAARCAGAPLDAVLLALGVMWAGPDAVRDGAIEPGVQLWCGSSAERRAADVLDAFDAAACDALAAAVADLVHERRAIDPELRADDAVPDEFLADLARAWPSGGSRLEPVARLALDVFRLWSRWLPGVASSGAPYLLRNVIRRPGTVELRDDAVRVVLRPAALDIVLEMSGFLSAVPRLPWLGDRGLSFSIDRS
jgi:hypothetical protein